MACLVIIILPLVTFDSTAICTVLECLSLVTMCTIKAWVLDLFMSFGYGYFSCFSPIVTPPLLTVFISLEK